MHDLHGARRIPEKAAGYGDLAKVLRTDDTWEVKP
jgi:hypothetical protein